ncbi:hypothetical protein AAC387_Pa07g2155 [Persea americana]
MGEMKKKSHCKSNGEEGHEHLTGLVFERGRDEGNASGALGWPQERVAAGADHLSQEGVGLAVERGRDEDLYGREGGRGEHVDRRQRLGWLWREGEMEEEGGREGSSGGRPWVFFSLWID